MKKLLASLGMYIVLSLFVSGVIASQSSVPSWEHLAGGFVTVTTIWALGAFIAWFNKVMAE